MCICEFVIICRLTLYVYVNAPEYLLNVLETKEYNYYCILSSGEFSSRAPFYIDRYKARIMGNVDTQLDM